MVHCSLFTHIWGETMGGVIVLIRGGGSDYNGLHGDGGGNAQDFIGPLQSGHIHIKGGLDSRSSSPRLLVPSLHGSRHLRNERPVSCK